MPTETPTEKTYTCEVYVVENRKYTKKGTAVVFVLSALAYVTGCHFPQSYHFSEAITSLEAITFLRAINLVRFFTSDCFKGGSTLPQCLSGRYVSDMTVRSLLRRLFSDGRVVKTSPSATWPSPLTTRKNKILQRGAYQHVRMLFFCTLAFLICSRF